MKVTKELKDKLVRIKAELESEIEAEKLNIQKYKSTELTVDYGVSLLFQEPEYCDEVEADDVENYEDLNASLTIYYEHWLSEGKADVLESKLRKKLESNNIIVCPQESGGVANGYRSIGFDIEAEGSPKL